MARISILSNDDIIALYAIPTLTNQERHSFFELDHDDQLYLDELGSIEQKVNYILQLGYYRAVSYFFQFTFQQTKEDVTFILEQYYPEDKFYKKQISKHHRYNNRNQVCKKFGVVDADDKFLLQLEKQARRLAKVDVLPKYILTGLLSFCQQKQIIKPAYSTFQKIISKALKSEQDRLVNQLYTKADTSLRKELDNLLKNDDLFYNLTLLKRDQKNFTTTEILNTLDKQKLIVKLYRKSQKLIQQLGISNQNIIYYANLAEFYTIQKLKIFKSINRTRLYLLCYIHRRLHKINDQLVASLVQKMLKYQKQGDDYQKKKVEMMEAFDKQLRNRAYKVMTVNVNSRIPDHLVRKKAFEVVPKEDYKRFLSDFKKPNFNREFYRWEQYGKLGRTIKRNIRPIFNAIDFSCDNDELRKAIAFLQNHISGNKSFKDYNIKDIPLDFFPKSLRTFLWAKPINGKSLKEKKIDGNRYEFMVYRQLQKGIGNITVYVKESKGYRSLEDELIDLEYWTTNKQKILNQLNMPLLSTNIIDILEELETSVESKFQYVNRRISNGENTTVKLKQNKQGKVTHWTLPYTPIDNGTNNHFFKKLPTHNISDIARFVDRETQYGIAFKHLQPKSAKIKPEMEIINACVIANATGTEIKKMIDICDIDGKDIKRTNKNFIRVQTLVHANNTIVNATEKLPIFKEYNLSNYGVHASVDGQKFSTRYNTIKSRHSKKYFGLKKGVVVMTLSANSLPICLKVIGANEHESHYLLDLVQSNTSDVEVTSVSGDMHSINRVNFALMHMFGYRFMPRFTQITKKSDNKLLCFGNVDQYDRYIIKPSKKAEKSLIIKEWDKVLRILVSLALKKTTQANIVRKLSAAKTTNPTLKALIALDGIVMTDYLLGYIDNKEEQEVVQRSLNRGESYHQLTSTISKVNGGRMLNGKNEIDLNINTECIRLIANIIIYHNASILSGLYQHYKLKDPEKAKEIIRWSPVAWRFVNLIGNYEFYNSKQPIDIQKIIENLISEFEI